MIHSKTTTNSLEGNYMTGINTTSAFDDATHVAFDLSREKPVRRCFRKGWEVGNGGLDDGDRDLLVDVYTDANSVFEFGLGESTRIAAAVGVPVFSGVDSDAVYVSESRKTSPSHFKFYFADVGLTGHWGMPLKVASKQVMQYQLSALQSEKLPFDVYLVDGRYRVASACAAFLHASEYGKKMSLCLCTTTMNAQSITLCRILRISLSALQAGILSSFKEKQTPPTRTFLPLGSNIKI